MVKKFSYLLLIVLLAGCVFFVYTKMNTANDAYQVNTQFVDMKKYTADYSEVTFSHPETAIVLKKCQDDVYVSKTKLPDADKRAKLQGSAEALSVAELFSRLLNVTGKDPEKIYEDELSALALVLLREGAIDDALAIWQCDAVSNQNIFASYRLLRLYQDGTDALKEMFSEATVSINVSPDTTKTYFWLTVLVHLEQQEKLGFLDPSIEKGMYVIGTMDGLQQGPGKLDQDQRVKIENDALNLVGKKYATVLGDTYITRLESHSMDSYMEAVKKMEPQDTPISSEDTSLVGRLCVAGVSVVQTYSNSQGEVGGYMTTSAEGVAIHDRDGKKIVSSIDEDSMKFSNTISELQDKYPQTSQKVCGM